MQHPAYLKKGDSVYLLNIARKGVYDVDFVEAVFADWGLECVLGETLSHEGFCQFAADAALRLKDLQAALDDESVKAIFFLRGGYGTVQILDRLDFTQFAKHPKWLVGYSDITYLHAHIARNFGIATVHAAMLSGWRNSGPHDLLSLRELLFGNVGSISFADLEILRPQKIQGVLAGGNLSILHTVIGTASDLETDGKILLIEDTYENLMSIERMLYAMRRSGKFDRVEAVLVGDFIIPVKDNETSNCMVPEFPAPDDDTILAAFRLMLRRFFANDGFPVVFGLPVGHRPERNFSLALGRSVNLSMQGNSVTLDYLP